MAVKNKYSNVFPKEIPLEGFEALLGTFSDSQLSERLDYLFDNVGHGLLSRREMESKASDFFEMVPERYSGEFSSAFFNGGKTIGEFIEKYSDSPQNVSDEELVLRESERTFAALSPIEKYDVMFRLRFDDVVNSLGSRDTRVVDDVLAADKGGLKIFDDARNTRFWKAFFDLTPESRIKLKCIAEGMRLTQPKVENARKGLGL